MYDGVAAYLELDAGSMTGPPPDADLRDFPWYPIYRHRLFSSRFHLLADDHEWRAGVTLWLRSWDQRPAGTLPVDDRELMALAGVSDLRYWKRLKKWALYGWTPGDDGRLHHATVAEVTNHAWERKKANQERTRAATEARQRKRDEQRNVHTGSRSRREIDPPQKAPDVTRGRRRANGSQPNGVDLVAVEPRIIGHRLPCDCPNCTRWVEQQTKNGA